MKRILVIADANSFWTKRYFEYVIPDWEAVLFPIWGIRPENEEWYQQRGISVYHDTHRLPVISRIPRVRMWARIALNARDLIALGPYDAVQNHYLSQRDLALGGRVARAFHIPWACCFWGSDLLRAGQKELARMKPWLEKCTAVHADYGQIREKVLAEFGEKVLAKTRLIPFGDAVLDRMAELSASADRRACKEMCGFDPDSTVICAGYNAGSAQQHKKILEQLALLPQETLKNMTLVLQMTYGDNDTAYSASVREMAAALPCRTVILREFMDETASARLRLAADIFLLGITTDAFSASFTEYLCAGAVCIRGSWIPYGQLDERGLYPPTFNDFSELPQLILKALHGDIPALDTEALKKLQQDYSATDSHDEWLALYENR